MKPLIRPVPDTSWSTSVQRTRKFNAYANSSHIITLDHEREQLVSDVESFIRRVMREEFREEK